MEDDDNTFRFDYSRGFLKWALTPPGYQKTWLVGIRNERKELVASITGVPVQCVVEEEKIKMAEINFLCVHKNHRVQRLAPLLIAEVTRRVNLRNKWQAVILNLIPRFTPLEKFYQLLSPKRPIGTDL